LLPNNVTYFYEVTIEEADLSVPLTEYNLSNELLLGIGLIELIKFRDKGHSDWVQTSSTGYFDIYGKTAPDANSLCALFSG
jgi:hypothetical protein